MSATLTAKETAKRLGLSYKHFLTHWRDWVEAKAFPPPLFPTGRPVWSAEMVDQVGRGLWVQHDWTARQLKDVARWANGWVWKRAPFSEYDRHRKNTAPESYDIQQGLFV